MTSPTSTTTAVRRLAIARFISQTRIRAAFAALNFVGGLVAAAPVPFLPPTFWRSESCSASVRHVRGSRVTR
jgi:hypothetical protein